MIQVLDAALFEQRQNTAGIVSGEELLGVMLDQEQTPCNIWPRRKC